VTDATPDVLERLDLAIRLAREAGERILHLYGATAHETKVGGSPVTAADLAANAAIVAGIAAAYPGEAILAEESEDSPARLLAERVWIVDPLDGTREYLSRNGEFSVMIGLAEAGRPVLGVVYLPVHGLLYAAAAGAGAWSERGGVRRPLRCMAPKLDALRLVGSRSHADPMVARVCDALGIDDIRPSGSVGIKCALIAEGERDLYIHPVPYLKEWDTCAPEVVLREAGGVVTDCRGAPLEYNKANASQPHGIVACPREIHAHVMQTIRPAYEAALGRRSGRGAGSNDGENEPT
jgi:3'(2'), 5'-bisphosphate nucleotidase